MKSEKNRWLHLENSERLLNFPFKLRLVGWCPDHSPYHVRRHVETFLISLVLDRRETGKALVNGVFPRQLNPPCLSVLRKGTILNTLWSPTHDELLFSYEEPAAAAVLRLGVTPTSFSMTNAIDSTISEIRTLMEGEDIPGRADQLDLLAIRLFLEIRLAGREMPQRPAPAPPRFSELVSYLIVHACSKIDLDQTVRDFGMSRRSFYRVWSQRFQISLSQFLLQHRLNAAEKLLQDSNCPISMIAELCSFSSVSYLNQCFCKKHGCSPREFRMRGQRRGKYPRGG